MLVWLVVAICFLACVTAWHCWQGITGPEATGLFIASIIAFSCQLTHIYNKNTTDTSFTTGFITSKIYRPSYTYSTKNGTQTMPEHWLLEQSVEHVPTSEYVNTSRTYYGENGTRMEQCTGRCLIKVGSNPSGYVYLLGSYLNAPVFVFDVSQEKFAQTQLGEASVATQSYFNPVMASDDSIFSELPKPIPYFKLVYYNKTARLHASGATPADNQRLEQLNASLAARYDISIGLIITPDPMFYEKLKRAWHGGKRNDFVIVIHSPDNATIDSVDILAWGNYALRQSVIQALANLNTINLDSILSILETTLQQGPDFTPQAFEKFRFLQVKIPTSDYAMILSYQVVLMLYLLTLLQLDPSTKTQKADLADIFETWDKNGHPQSWRSYLHPFSSTGLLFFYTGFPYIFFWLWELMF